MSNRGMLSYLMVCLVVLGFAALTLSGCKPRAAVIDPVEVKIPVMVRCNFALVTEPRWNVPQLAANAAALDRLKAALADLDLSKGYIEELRAALSACG